MYNVVTTFRNNYTFCNLQHCHSSDMEPLSEEQTESIVCLMNSNQQLHRSTEGTVPMARDTTKMEVYLPQQWTKNAKILSCLTGYSNCITPTWYSSLPVSFWSDHPIKSEEQKQKNQSQTPPVTVSLHFTTPDIQY